MPGIKEIEDERFREVSLRLASTLGGLSAPLKKEESAVGRD